MGMQVDDLGTTYITALTRTTRWLLYVLVCIPKLLISVYLLSLGCEWLSTTTNFEALVMNCVAMEFVLHIDELLFIAFLPMGYRRQVEDINFFFQHSLPERQHEERGELCSYV